ncbi:DUF6550 family protein [Paenibacillus durus]|uniref:DUF6550 family protein n=1 Tax=Paenibacillus durus TaxID=44251 RepID=UPI000693C14F|nr:DUF6550 family protein [Paenibacillus durus]
MKRKTGGVIGGLIIVGLIAVWMAWPNTKSDEAPAHSTTVPTTTPSDISITNIQPRPSTTSPSPSPSSVVVAEVKPQPTLSEAPVLQPEKEKKHIEVPITKPEKTSSPTEPPTPKAKATNKPQSPASPPKYEEKETLPNKQQTTEPKAGDKNSKGQVWVPGFGWVNDSGANQGGVSTSDGDWNKQVGSMD